MELKTRDGNLTLGSAYKLIVTGWILSWGTLIGLILILLIITTLITGETMVNGEVVEGRAKGLAYTLPFLILLPLIVTLHAFMFGGFILGGLWLYRLKRPIKVLEEDL